MPASHPRQPPEAKHRPSRNRWTLLAFAPGAVVAAVYGARSAWWGLVRDHPKWDDHLLIGIAWLAAAIGAAVLLRLVWALFDPERLLPRWLAAAALGLVAVGGIMVLLYVSYASAWGP